MWNFSSLICGHLVVNEEICDRACRVFRSDRMLLLQRMDGSTRFFMWRLHLTFCLHNLRVLWSKKERFLGTDIFYRGWRCRDHESRWMIHIQVIHNFIFRYHAWGAARKAPKLWVLSDLLTHVRWQSPHVHRIVKTRLMITLVSISLYGRARRLIHLVGSWRLLEWCLIANLSTALSDFLKSTDGWRSFLLKPRWRQGSILLLIVRRSVSWWSYALVWRLFSRWHILAINLQYQSVFSGALQGAPYGSI